MTRSVFTMDLMWMVWAFCCGMQRVYACTP